jgi:hydrogenase expression/formation protein HypD
MMRVPGAHGSPLEHNAGGMDVRIVYSPSDALKLARSNPDRHVIFFPSAISSAPYPTIWARTFASC